MNVIGPLIAAVIVASCLTQGVAASATAPRCFGRDATIVGSTHRDVVRGTSHSDVIVTLGGPDLVRGRAGDDVICTGKGNDSVFGNAGGDDIDGGDGNDSIDSGPGFFDDVIGGPGNDALSGGRDNEGLVDYSTATDAVDASLTTGKATGGAGADILSGFDSIQGSSFDDKLDGNKTAFGNGLFGGDGNDTLTGRGGPDVFVGEGGNDSIDGGNQAKGELDFAGYRFAPGPVVVNLATGSATGWGTDSLTEVEGVGGSDSFGDSLTGDANDNGLIPFGGSDRVDGGDGEDLVIYSSAENDMSIDLGTGVATGQGSDTLSNIEDAQGGPKDDSITGTGAVNRLLGGAGKDTIQAGAGDDELNGGDGSDSLDGGDGKDLCINGEKDTNCETEQSTPPLIQLLLVRLEGLAAYR